VGKLAGREWSDSPWVFYATSAVITLITLVLPWLVAVLLRRLMPRLIGPTTGRLIWLAGAVAIAWPTLRLLAGAED
jgi:hypothetical protein